MFMFRSKRSTLTKRLLKARVRRERSASLGGSATCASAPGSTLAPGGGGVGGGVPPPPAALLKRLKQPQLEQLLAAVESRGADPSRGACVLLPRDPPVPAGTEPHVLSCQAWRWPDLRVAVELRCLPGCASAANSLSVEPAFVCCNPYHWSRLCTPESPPPPYGSHQQHLRQDRAPSENDAEDGHGEADVAFSSSAADAIANANTTNVEANAADGDAADGSCVGVGAGAGDERWQGSLTTSGEGAPSGRQEWCHLAYWELASRVGRLFPVRRPAVSVSAGAAEPAGDGLCLATLATATVPPLQTVLRVRAKIGLGVTLSREGDGVWAYNRSDAPIFVNSPALDDPDSRTLIVYRVPPGHCLNVFSSDTPETHWSRWGAARALEGRLDPNAVRISFAKGWGPKYSRQQVTACPCWLEVFLRPR